MEQALTNGAAGAAPSTLELLLRADVVSVKANMPTARYEISRLSEAAGAPVVFTLRALPYGRVQELKRLTEEADIQILLAGCVEPDLKAAALQEKFQGVTPAETVKAMLLPGEIADLAIAVEKLSGYRRTTLEEVKNGCWRQRTRSWAWRITCTQSTGSCRGITTGEVRAKMT